MAKDKYHIRVRNWDRFQHYKDRNPPWIKLHTCLLEDDDFEVLHSAAKAHLMLIWLLASRRDNVLPISPEWIAKKISEPEVDLAELVEAGFLEVVTTDGRVLTTAVASKVLR